MQAIEATGTIDAQGQLSLDQPLQAHSGRVRVIVLLPDPSSQTLENEVQPTATTSATDMSSLLNLVERIQSQVPPEEWEKLPRDLSINHDHYLYGSPKVEE